MRGTGDRLALDAGQNASIVDFFNSISAQPTLATIAVKGRFGLIFSVVRRLRNGAATIAAFRS